MFRVVHLAVETAALKHGALGQAVAEASAHQMSAQGRGVAALAAAGAGGGGGHRERGGAARFLERQGLVGERDGDVHDATIQQP